MRRILAGSIGLALGMGALHASAEEPQWRAVGLGAPVAAPAVTLGAPIAAIGTSQPVAPRIARGQAAERPPMPIGPAPNAADKQQLPLPTPFEPVPPPAQSEGVPFAMNGPVSSVPAANGIGFDPGLAPLPGGCFTPDAMPCGPAIWGSAEYLLWWIRDAQIPALLTTSSPPALGTIGFGDTQIIYGNSSIVGQERSGGRFNIGGMFPCCPCWSWETGYFFLGDRTATTTVTNPGTAVLARPFQFADGRQTSELISFPGIFAGSFAATTRNSLWGAEANLKTPLWNGCRARIDGLVGFRYLHFDEELRIAESFNALPTVTNPQFAGASGMILDNFRVNNDFYGGQVGLTGELRRGPWSINTIMKVALGNTHQVADIGGGQLITQPGGMRATSGLLTQPTNSGHFTQDKFTVVPEVGFNVGWQATPHLKLFVGYSFLYWSQVLRAGDQVDPVINTPAIAGTNPPRPATFPITQSPTAPFRPLVPMRDTDFWAQGINFGLQLTW